VVRVGRELHPTRSSVAAAGAKRVAFRRARRGNPAQSFACLLGWPRRDEGQDDSESRAIVHIPLMEREGYHRSIGYSRGVYGSATLGADAALRHHALYLTAELALRGRARLWGEYTSSEERLASREDPDEVGFRVGV